MARAYATSTASIRAPVVLSFTCPKRGRHASVNRTALLSTQAIVRAYDSSGAGAIARQSLAAAAGDQIGLIVERLQKGQLNVPLNDEDRSPSQYVARPHCGIRQIADVTPRRMLYPRLFALRLVGLFLALVAAFALIVALTNRQRPVSSGAVMLGEWVSILVVVAGILYKRSRSGKAYSDPALMEKRYRSMLNPHMEAMLMPVPGNVRRVDILKRGWSLYSTPTAARRWPPPSTWMWTRCSIGRTSRPAAARRAHPGSGENRGAHEIEMGLQALAGWRD